MVMHLSRSVWVKFSGFRKKKFDLFLAQNVFLTDFFAQIGNKRLKIELCTKFQPDWTKGKGAQISAWNSTKKLLDVYLPHSDEVSKLLLLLRDFVQEYHHAKFGGNWTTNKGETKGGTMCISQSIFYENRSA